MLESTPTVGGEMEIFSWVAVLPWASDWIGVVGLVLTLGGLVWSIVMATRARSAAVQAKDAARAAAEAVVRNQESVGIEVAIGKVNDLITLYTSNKRHAVPDKLDWLIDFLDRLRHGPHVRNVEDRRKIQGYVNDLSEIHRDLLGRDFAEPLDPNADASRDVEKQKYYRFHEVFSNLRGFLRDLEAAGRPENRNGTG
jgi:hypothetical protein